MRTYVSMFSVVFQLLLVFFNLSFCNIFSNTMPFMLSLRLFWLKQQQQRQQQKQQLKTKQVNLNNYVHRKTKRNTKNGLELVIGAVALLRFFSLFHSFHFSFHSSLLLRCRRWCCFSAVPMPNAAAVTVAAFFSRSFSCSLFVYFFRYKHTK